jgi:hypothetical protein
VRRATCAAKAQAHSDIWLRKNKIKMQWIRIQYKLHLPLYLVHTNLPRPINTWILCIRFSLILCFIHFIRTLRALFVPLPSIWSWSKTTFGVHLPLEAWLGLKPDRPHSKVDQIVKFNK